jgi:cellulose 1,4-beta-cellobiosidase
MKTENLLIVAGLGYLFYEYVWPNLNLTPAVATPAIAAVQPQAPISSSNPIASSAQASGIPAQQVPSAPPYSPPPVVVSPYYTNPSGPTPSPSPSPSPSTGNSMPAPQLGPMVYTAPPPPAPIQSNFGASYIQSPGGSFVLQSTPSTQSAIQQVQPGNVPTLAPVNQPAVQQIASSFNNNPYGETYFQSAPMIGGYPI